MSFIRVAGISCVVGALLWLAALFVEYGFGLFPPGSGALFVLNQLMFVLAETGFVLGTLGLLRARAAGAGWFGQLALAAFALSWAMLLLALVRALITDDFAPTVLTRIGWPLSMLTGLLAGSAVAAARRWQSWQRYALLTYSLYIALGVWLPGVIANQERTLITETIWGLAWLPVGLAIYTGGGAQPTPLQIGGGAHEAA